MVKTWWVHLKFGWLKINQPVSLSRDRLRAARKYPRDALLFNRVYKEVCVIWGSSVLLLKERKKTATLHVTINDERSDGKWLKNRELFSLEVNQ